LPPLQRRARRAAGEHTPSAGHARTEPPPDKKSTPRAASFPARALRRRNGRSVLLRHAIPHCGRAVASRPAECSLRRETWRAPAAMRCVPPWGPVRRRSLALAHPPRGAGFRAPPHPACGSKRRARHGRRPRVPNAPCAARRHAP